MKKEKTMKYTEDDIVKNWKGNVDTPIVSICSITYNHEKYIATAIESFLMQKTDFPFEIVIDDDCSTDNTQKIIQRYQEKYPNIIKAHLRKKNVGAMLNFIDNMKRARGEYLALCEGDDYWIDENKLQYQIEKMQDYPKCQLSFHPAVTVKNFKEEKALWGEHYASIAIIPIQDVIKGSGEFCPTPSLIIKKEVIDELPEFINEAPVGDYFIQVLASASGGALYLNRVMSAYRVHDGGWSSTIQKDFTKYEQFATSMVHTINQIDLHYSKKYHHEFLLMISIILKGIFGQKYGELSQKITLSQSLIAPYPKNDQVTLLSTTLYEILDFNTWLERQVETHKQTLQSKEEGITWLEEQLESRKKTLETKEEGISWLKEQLENHKKTVEDKDEGITWLEEQLESHKKTLQTKDEGIAWLEKKMTTMERKMQGQNEAIELYEKLFEKTDSAMLKLEEENVWFAQQLETHKKALEEKDAHIHRLQQQMFCRASLRRCVKRVVSKLMGKG